MQQDIYQFFFSSNIPPAFWSHALRVELKYKKLARLAVYLFQCFSAPGIWNRFQTENFTHPRALLNVAESYPPFFLSETSISNLGWSLPYLVYTMHIIHSRCPSWYSRCPTWDSHCPTWFNLALALLGIVVALLGIVVALLGIVVALLGIVVTLLGIVAT